MKKNKKTIYKEINVSKYDLSGDFDKVISKLEEIKRDNPEFEKFELDLDNIYYDSYGEGEITIQVSREETDEECSQRIKEEKQTALDFEKRERDRDLKEFERLKKKFGM